MLFLSFHAFNWIKFDVTCITGRYESVVGQSKVISVERDDYYDNEPQDITFSVNGIVLDNVVNSYSQIQKEQFCQADGKETEVQYAYFGRE